MSPYDTLYLAYSNASAERDKLRSEVERLRRESVTTAIGRCSAMATSEPANRCFKEAGREWPHSYLRSCPSEARSKAETEEWLRLWAVKIIQSAGGAWNATEIVKGLLECFADTVPPATTEATRCECGKLATECGLCTDSEQRPAASKGDGK